MNYHGDKDSGAIPHWGDKDCRHPLKYHRKNRDQIPYCGRCGLIFPTLDMKEDSHD